MDHIPVFITIALVGLYFVFASNERSYVKKYEAGKTFNRNLAAVWLLTKIILTLVASWFAGVYGAKGIFAVPVVYYQYGGILIGIAAALSLSIWLLKRFALPPLPPVPPTEVK